MLSEEHLLLGQFTSFMNILSHRSWKLTHKSLLALKSSLQSIQY